MKKIICLLCLMLGVGCSSVPRQEMDEYCKNIHEDLIAMEDMNSFYCKISISDFDYKIQKAVKESCKCDQYTNVNQN